MSSITLYEQPFFKGNSKTFNENVRDLAIYSFLKMVRSLKVEGKPWIAYGGQEFCGDFKIYKEGDHTNLGDFSEKISSLQVIKVSLEDPEIVLYEHINYGGKKVSVLEVNRNVKGAGLEGHISSHKVKKGAWILYTETELHGKRMFSMEDQPNYCILGWNDQVSSLKPLTDEDFHKPI
uniref:Ep37-A2 n=1 Tax=Callorhinchus milii TaxID=7868 RepID=V9L9G9_CALMI